MWGRSPAPMVEKIRMIALGADDFGQEEISRVYAQTDRAVCCLRHPRFELLLLELERLEAL